MDSLDRKIDNENDKELVGDRIPSNKNDYEELINKMTTEKLLKVLTNQEKKVIIYRYYKELTQTQIAKLLDTSQVQVSRIEKRAIEKMRCYA